MNLEHRQIQVHLVSHLTPGPWPVSLLGATAVRQLLNGITDSKTAATRRQVLLFHLQPAQRTHGKTLTDRQVDRQAGRQTDGEADRVGDRELDRER